jgi:iron complex transport system ATP-binding protein
VTAGVLNVLDSDYENAKDMHIPVVAEAPFAPISPENHAENLALIDESVAVVVSPFPVGPGNLRNLEAATHALRTGKRVLLVRPAETQAVDFVDGKADAIIKNLISSGATVVADVSELLSRLAPRGG